MKYYLIYQTDRENNSKRQKIVVSGPDKMRKKNVVFVSPAAMIMLLFDPRQSDMGNTLFDN